MSFKCELGPRQAKPATEILRAIQTEGRTFIELTGTHGKPETEHRSVYNSPFDPNFRPDVKAVLDALQQRFEPVTVKNLPNFVSAATQALAVLQQQRPVRDKRITLEEHATREQRSADAFAHEEQRRLAAEAAWKRISALQPKNAEALIVAELLEDTSDPMSDYFGHKLVRRVAIGWRGGTREDFRQLRAAAARFPETAHLGTGDAKDVEHRETYSMGQGNYLGTGRHSGWRVRSYELKYRDRSEVVEPDHLEALARQSKADDADYCQHGLLICEICDPEATGQVTASGGAGVAVRRNVEKDGVEIHFAAKPDRGTIDMLKANGWRWSMRGSCWYRRYDDVAWRFAQSLLYVGPGVFQSNAAPSNPVAEPEVTVQKSVQQSPPLTLRSFALRFFPGYRGRKFDLRIHPGGISLVSCWSGGSRSDFRLVRLEDMKTVPIPENGSGFSAVDRQYGPSGLPVKLPAPGYAVVEHCIFSGKDLGLRVYLHPDNAARMVEAPK
jgi:hypothetical protein